MVFVSNIRKKTKIHQACRLSTTYSVSKHMRNEEFSIVNRLSGAKLQSDLSYHVTGEESFGRLHCRASNQMGQQVHPCTFEVLPKGKLLHIK